MSLTGHEIAGAVLDALHGQGNAAVSTAMLREAYGRLDNPRDTYDAKLRAEISYLLARRRELSLGERKAFAEESIRTYEGLDLDGRYAMATIPEGEVSEDSAGIGMEAYDPILWLGEGIPDDGMHDGVVRFRLWQELGLEPPEHMKLGQPSGKS